MKADGDVSLPVIDGIITSTSFAQQMKVYAIRGASMHLKKALSLFIL
jgi:hypothetical protein